METQQTISIHFLKRDTINRLANMRASFAFRLAAMVATDNRPGKVW